MSNVFNRTLRRGFFTGIALMSCAICITSWAQASNKIEMHRAGAGDLVDGWVSATSTRGGFSVQLPCKYNDFTAHDARLTADVVGCRSGNLGVAVSRIKYRSHEDALHYFEQVAGAKGLRGAKSVRGTHNGQPSVTLDIHEGSQCGRIDAIQAGDVNFLISSEAPSAQCDAVGATGAKMLESLKIGQKVG